MNWFRLFFKKRLNVEWRAFPIGSRQWQSFTKYLGLSLCCCFLIVSCTGSRTSTPTESAASPSAGAEAGSARISVGSVEKPRTLDPADGYEVAISDIITSLSDRLYTYVGDSDELEPQLATDLPTISDDGLTYKISTREGVVFHDGTPFNAEAMAFSLKRFAENGGKPAFLLSDVMESVEATGENEITIKLKYPFAPFPAVLAFPGMCAVSPKAYEIGEGKFKPNEFIGTGPYKLTAFNPSQVSIERNDDYWGEKPPNQGIDFQYLSSPANLYNSFTTGALDIAYRDLEPEQVNSLRDSTQAKNYNVVEKPSSGISYFVLNVKQEPLNQVEVRQAIAAMVDRNLITERIFRGLAQPSYSIVPTNFKTSKPVFQEAYGDGNTEKAKQLLTQAGFSASKPFEWEIWYSSNSSERQQLVTLLQEYAKQNMDGLVVVKPQPVESTKLFADVAKGVYPSYVVSWFPDFGDADNYVSPFFACEKGSAAAGCEEGASASQGFFYYNQQLIDLLQKQREEQDAAVRAETFGQIQDILAKDVPLVPLFQETEYVFSQQPVEDLELNPVLGLSVWEVNKGA